MSSKVVLQGGKDTCSLVDDWEDLISSEEESTGPESGYMSASTGRQVSKQSLLSEQAVDAMLRVRDKTDHLSVLSEDEDIGSICGNALASPCIDLLPSPPLAHQQEIHHQNDAAPPRRGEVQLRYMLQILIEAGCLEWATIVSLVLQDAMAIIRIVNSARSSMNAYSVVERLHDGFVQLEEHKATNQKIAGYAMFLNSIQPQIKTLYKFLDAASPTNISSKQQQVPSANNSFTLKPPPASLKHTTPPHIRPVLPRSLSDPVNPHAPEEGCSPPRQASTPVPTSFSVADISTTASLIPEAEEDQAGCVIS